MANCGNAHLRAHTYYAWVILRSNRIRTPVPSPPSPPPISFYHHTCAVGSKVYGRVSGSTRSAKVSSTPPACRTVSAVPVRRVGRGRRARSGSQENVLLLHGERTVQVCAYFGCDRVQRGFISLLLGFGLPDLVGDLGVRMWGARLSEGCVRGCVGSFGVRVYHPLI